MVEEDIPAALALWQGLPGIGLSDADTPCALSRYLARNPGGSFVALLEAELVGVSLAGHDGRRGYLHHVAVSPTLQKSGIGKQLVDASLAALRAEGIGKVHIFVKADNDAGKAFWRHTGWSERGDISMMSINLVDQKTDCGC